MRRLGKAIVEFLKDESGPTTVEYAIVMALLIAFIAPTVVNMTSKPVATYTTVSTTLKGTGS
jgi:pilus assembly protein Flp/PilA